MRAEVVLEVLDRFRARLENAEPSGQGTWETAEAAVQELDALREAVRRGRNVGSELRLLVAPTGALQDHSIDNGWGDEFVSLALRLERAL